MGVYYADVGANGNQGAAYVFTRSSGVWGVPQKLLASDGAATDFFGDGLALDNQTLVIGASGATIGANTDQGAAYVFVRNGSAWTEQAKLTADDGTENDWFGIGIGLDGDTVIIGSYYAEVNSNPMQGSAYVFTRSGSAWSQQQKLIAGDGTENDWFGRTVALDGDTVAIGAQYAEIDDNLYQGAAYVFTLPPNAYLLWTK